MLLKRPGIYHTMYENGPKLPGQEEWLEQTCALVESFVDAMSEDLDDQGRSLVSFSVHLLADHLFALFGRDASWDGLDPEQFMTRLDKDMSPSPAFVPAVCGALYAYMVDIGGIDRMRGAYLASALASCADGAIEEQLGNRAQARSSSQKARRDRRTMN